IAASTGSPASRRLTKLMPLTTRPSLTSRQGMTRTLNMALRRRPAPARQPVGDHRDDRGRRHQRDHKRHPEPSDREHRTSPRALDTANAQAAQLDGRPFAHDLPVCEDARLVRHRIVMADQAGVPNPALLLRSTAIFRELSNDQLAEIWSHAKVHNLLRGETLVRQNAPSDSVYIVVSGRFEVWVEGQTEPINEIGVGEPIGEIGFFSGAPRNATIVAARDSVVLELDRASFDDAARDVPAIQQTLLRAMARRLGTVAQRASEPRGPVARTVVVIAGGTSAIPPIFHERLDQVVGRRGKGRLLTWDYLTRHFPGRAADDPSVSNWLNAVEHEYELIVHIADDSLTDWTRKAIRQADQVLIVVAGEAAEPVNPVEAFA